MRYGLPPARSPDAQVAQLVEHATENRSVGGSIPPLGTIPPNPLRSPERPNSSQLCSYDSVLAGFLWQFPSQSVPPKSHRILPAEWVSERVAQNASG